MYHEFLIKRCLRDNISDVLFPPVFVRTSRFTSRRFLGASSNGCIWLSDAATILAQVDPFLTLKGAASSLTQGEPARDRSPTKITRFSRPLFPLALIS